MSATYVNIDLRLSSYYYGKMKLYILCTALLISRLNVRKGVNVIGQMLVDFYENHKKQCIIKSPSFFMWRLVMVECYITCNWRKSNKHLSAIAFFYARYPRTSECPQYDQQYFHWIPHCIQFLTSKWTIYDDYIIVHEYI